MVLLGRSQQALSDLATELSRSGVEAHVLVIDLAAPGTPQQVESELAQREIYCDVLVNCAGFGLFGPAADIDREEQLSVIGVNVRALTDLTLRFLPGMIARRRGGILNVGSIAGYVPGPNMAVYHATKAYVRSFTAALAAEVAGTGVTVTCLSPGIVRTAFFERASWDQTRLVKLLPRSNASDVAETGWRGFRAGKRLVIPGVANRIILAALALVSDAVLLRLISALQRRPED
jgi:short-subunit dehydrogenase